MASLYHPDKVAHLAPEFREMADRKMKEINIAYGSLKKINELSPQQPAAWQKNQ
jgi:preprotein translocase subunit Sec63